MSISFTRNKEKRPRSTTSETNNSFVKNVASRVTGLLPATITKWFSSPSSSNANGSTPAADVTDSSTEDEATESPVSSQPPAKRMRFSTPGNLNRFGAADGNSVVRLAESKDSPTLPYTVQSPPGRSTFRRETNYVSTPIRANEESVVEKSDKDNTVFQHTVSVITQAAPTKRKSIFEALTPSNSQKRTKPSLNTSLDPRLPNFKPALLGSPFYHGRTMYGGASYSYINQPNIKQRKVAYVNESNTSDTATMSHSARTIMDLLENYSSPLTEAKRIPKYVKPQRNESIIVNMDNSQNNRVKSYKSQELQIPGIASILQLKQKARLMDTTSAARQLIASYSSSAEYSPYPSPSNNTHKEYSSKETNNSLTTKVKTRVTRQLRGDNLNEAPPPPVQLPTAVLQIDILPKFTIDKPAETAYTAPSSSISSIPTFSKTITTTTAVSNAFSTPNYVTISPTSTYSSKPGITCNNRPFKFSSPIKVSSEITEKCKTATKFAFASPNRSIDRPEVDDKKVDSSVVVGSVKETAKSVDNTIDWKCSECWVSNKSNVDKCVCCGNKRDIGASETPTKCSVCKLANSQSHVNKCVNCEKLHSKIISSNTIKSLETSQWKCSDDGVPNNENMAKCGSCGANNPNKSNNDTTKSQSSDGWDCFICWTPNNYNESNCVSCGTSRKESTFNKLSKCSICKLADSLPNNNKCVNCEKMQSSITDGNKPATILQWKCQECWVGNNENIDKCVCCGAGNPKKLSIAATIDKNSTVTKSVGNGDWKCEECWITNKSNVDKCVACGVPKLQPKRISKQGFVTPSSKSSDDVFKKIATSQKGTKWECLSCLVRNDDDKTICVCCGADRDCKTDNVGLKSFNFGQNTENTFKFGINPNFQNTSTSKMDHTSIADEIPMSQCETNNNVLDKTPTFTFTLPTKKSGDNVKEIKEIKNESSKNNFTFGIQKPTTDLSNVNKAPEPNKNAEAIQSIQEVPKVDVSSSVQSQVKPTPVLFTLQAATTTTPSPIVLELLGSEKNDTSNASTSQSVKVTPSAQPENKFSFSVGGIKPSMNMFSSSAATSSTVATTPLLFASPLQTAVTTTAAPSIPMFQKPDINTTSTVTMFANKDPVTTAPVSLFQKTETISSTAATSKPTTASFFSFGSNTQTTKQAPVEKPKFNFMFGNTKPETSTAFKPSFGSLDSTSSANKFALPTTNLLSGGNGLSGNPVGGPNGLSTGSALTGNVSSPSSILGATNEMPTNPLSGGNGLQSSSALPGNIFGAPVMKENMWQSNNNNNNNSTSTNIFVSNMTPNALQKPATFTFGSSPFNANSAPAFGTNAQPAQNIFGISNQNSGQSPLFANPANQTQPVFGSTPANNNNAPSMGMFGTPNSATSSFGAVNQPIPSFETPLITSTPAGSFNFGSQQPSAVFGFGQQQQAQPSGVYSFGSPASSPVQVQFSMGSAPNTVQRRVRKAVRRNTQR